MSTNGGTTGTRRETLGIVVGFFLLSTAAAAYEIAPASVFPAIQDSLGLSSSAAGWLVSIMYATAVVTSVPIGVVLDRFSVRRVVGLATVALVVAGGWGWYAATAGAYGWLLVSRVLGGLAYVTFWNAGANVVGSAVPPRQRATAVGVFTASAPVGFALGQFGSPLIANVAGWPAILPLYAGVAVVGVAFFAAATRRRVPGVDAPSPDGAALRELFGSRAVWTVCALCFLAYSLYLFVNTWLPSFLASEFSISLAASGLLTALFPAIGAVARSTSGVVTDRAFGGRRRRVIVSSFAVATPAVVAFAFVSRLGAVVGAVVVVGFAIQLVTGLIFSYIAELVAPSVRATAVSLLTSVGLLGAFAAPIAAGAIIDYAGYTPAFLAAGGVAVIGVLLALRAPEPTRA
ncbi:MULTISPECIES: MFS transporter [Haloferax]|uniref:Hexuronate transporter n=1 Tax=Haloferax massiliensis TaxID=1476858 RepID=A0A0D6JLC1_9EURY|nr:MULTISPECIES: MFS transporter [Haloferax]MDS0243657.1 MFS transporter [Haloferax sp. S2CR25]MDS0446778.1 MFS transporter [Haloferax sp. S2CR25-2]CQR48684.1 Hexuronate transporter [Haloferax massiliensis]